MPETPEGQKKLNTLELTIVGMQVDMKNLGGKMDEVCQKIDGLSSKIEQFQMQGHDNTRDISDMKLDIAKMQLKNDTIVKTVDKAMNNLGKMKSYVAGGVAVLGVVMTIVMYVIDKFVR